MAIFGQYLSLGIRGSRLKPSSTRALEWRLAFYISIVIVSPEPSSIRTGAWVPLQVGADIYRDCDLIPSKAMELS